MRLLTPFVSISLIPFLIGPLPAQTNLPTEALQLRLVEGDGAAVPAGSQSKKGFTVEVSDGSGRAIPDAAVAFRLPDSGATGVFQDGGHSNVAYTNAEGRVHFAGIQWSAASGIASIRITGSKGNAHAGMLLEETLTAGTPPPIVSSTVAPPVVTPVIKPATGTPVIKPATVTPVIKPATVTPVIKPATVTPVAPTVTFTPPQPGEMAPLQTAAPNPPKIQPARPLASTAQPVAAASEEPNVSVTHTSTGAGHSHSGKTKWIILVAALAGGGAAAAFIGKGKSTASTASSSSLSIGSPTVSIGHP